MQDNYANVTEKLLHLARNKYYSKYRGEVTENIDPLHRGRLEVKVPSLLRSEKVWAMPCLPFGGKDMGIFMVPSIGTGVWVEFEGGDISFPIWSGCYWGDEESPKNNKTDEPNVRLIKSETGLTISLDDKDEIVTISDKANDNIITIDVTKGKIKIKSATTVVVEAQNVQLGGEAAFEPVVKGATLLAYLNAMILTVKPLGLAVLPPPPNILSNKVKTL